MIFVGINAYVFVPVFLLALGIDLPRLNLPFRKQRKEADITDQLATFDQIVNGVSGYKKGARA